MHWGHYDSIGFDECFRNTGFRKLRSIASKITGMESEARPENFFQGRPGRPALKFGLRAEAAGSPLRKSSLENENVETIRQKTRLGTAKSLI